MTTTLTVGLTDVTAKLQHKSLIVKRNGLDFTLINPASAPVIDDEVALTDPTWAGQINSIESVAYVGITPYYKCHAKNEDALPDNGPAAFNLSDTPNGSTTFGYDELTVYRTLNEASGTEQVRAKCTVFQLGLEAGDEIDITSAAEGFSAETFTIMELTQTWPATADAPKFELDLGLGDYATATEAGLFPVTMDDTITKIVLGGEGVRFGDLLLGDSQHFAGGVGNWTNTGGALVRDTAAGFRYGAFPASLKFTTSAHSQYLECPVPGEFVAGREYQALLLVKMESGFNRNGRSLGLGVIGTDSSLDHGPSAASHFAALDGDYWALFTRWVPTANRTGVKLRFTRSDASGDAVIWHVGWARVVAVIPNNDVGLSLFRSPDLDDYGSVYSASLTGQLDIQGAKNGAGLLVELDAARLHNAPATASVDVTASGINAYAQHAPGDLADAGIDLYAGDDLLGVRLSEKDSATVQLYPDLDDIDVELRDRGTGGWRASDHDGNQTGLLSTSPLRHLASDPSGAEGDWYFNTTLKAIRVHNGTAWLSMVGSGTIWQPVMVEEAADDWRVAVTGDGDPVMVEV